MSTYLTPKEAASTWLCPVSRVFGRDLQGTCRGPECAVWRWKPHLTTDPGWASAIKREMVCQAQDYNANLPEGKKERSPAVFHKSAVAAVARNPEGFGIEREQGCCGFGGPVT